MKFYYTFLVYVYLFSSEHSLFFSTKLCPFYLTENKYVLLSVDMLVVVRNGLGVPGDFIFAGQIS